MSNAAIRRWGTVGLLGLLSVGRYAQWGAPAAASSAAPSSGSPQKPSRATTWKFDFGPGKVETNTLPVLPTTAYSIEQGYGFEPGATVAGVDRGGPDALRGDFCTSDKPFRFSVALPEGNYKVIVTLGDQAEASNTTIKAEARRLVLESVGTTPGKFETHTFMVNVRTPRITADESVRINTREQGPPLAVQWDDKLTLEFNGTRPCICALEIIKSETATTVFVAGDSTVTDQQNEPWAGWGQMLPRFFQPDVAVANYAESGLTLGSFRAQKRLEKVLRVIKPGDYVLIQFGHNDQKDKAPGAGPFTSYKANLHDYIRQIKSNGGVPVLVTPMERRRWTPEGKPGQTLSDYAEAVRQAGKEEMVPVIDLNALSLTFYTTLGAENSKKAFVHYPAGTFPGQTQVLKDDTHFNNYGAYELARCVVEGIKAQVPALARLLVGDTMPFDPAKPDPVESFHLPASPFAQSEKPAGS